MKKILKITAALLASFLIPAAVADATTVDKIKDAQNAIDALKNEKEDAEQQVNDIEDRRGDLKGDLGQLNNKLTEIVGAINDLEKQLAEKEQEIATATEELAAAKARYEQQYEDMKLRIQYMYENAESGLWQRLLGSSSFADFLNRAEYVVQINAYDRDLLKKFEQLREEVAEKKKTLEGQQAELAAMQEDMRAKKDSVNSLIATTQGNLKKAEADLANAQGKVEEIADKLEKMIAYEKELEIKKAKEDAARLAAIKAQEKEDISKVIYTPEGGDAYLLAAIIQCESEGESYDGKLAVGSVVLNRVKSSYFPNSIAGVIYQPGQFSPVASGRLAYRLETGVNGDCMQAAQEVLNGRITLNCLYFRVNNGFIQGTVIGNHVFY